MRIAAALLAFLGLADARKRTQRKTRRKGENIDKDLENVNPD